MPASKRRRIDWQTLPIVTQPDLNANPSNPYAEMSTAQREDVFKDLARAILLRQAAGLQRN